MSELIANSKHRQKILKGGIIKDLHAGGVDPEQIKSRFSDLLEQVGPSEIGELEQSLINEGLPVEEIQKLCDVHVAVFKESLEKQKAAAAVLAEVETNPLADLEDENRKIKALVADIKGGLVEQIGGAAEGGKQHQNVIRAVGGYAARTPGNG